jgi:hypothetical protein
MHKPLERDDFVGSIIDELRPWRFSETAVADDVRRAITMVGKTIPMWERIGNQRANRTHAKKIEKALARLEALMASAPEPLDSALYLLFANMKDPELFRYMHEVCHQAISEGYGLGPHGRARPDQA